MADFAITISVSLLLCGIERTTKFGAATFGTSKWTIGSHDLDTHTIKLISNSLVPDTGNLFSYLKVIENSLVPTFETSMEGLADGSGWNYQFAYPTSDAESRSLNSFSTVAGATTGWSTASVGTTTWS